MTLNSDRDFAPTRELREEKVTEGLPETRRIQRPRLVSRPMPRGWTPDGRGLHHKGPVDIRVLVLADDTIAPIVMTPSNRFSAPLEAQEAAARDVLELLSWLRHEQAVRRQDEQGDA